MLYVFSLSRCRIPTTKFHDRENPNDLWIHVTSPEDDDREIELMDFFSEKTADILMDYGYHLLIMPSR